MTPVRLLVVENDLASLELMVEVFRSLKAEVHPVSDSEKVVGRTQQNNSYPSHPGSFRLVLQGIRTETD
jgi:CheY-like chemotaxis protein